LGRLVVPSAARNLAVWDRESLVHGVRFLAALGTTDSGIPRVSSASFERDVFDVQHHIPLAGFIPNARVLYGQEGVI
jgi:hypothetical protein